MFTFKNTANSVKLMVIISIPSGLLGPTCENLNNLTDSGKNKLSVIVYSGRLVTPVNENKQTNRINIT